MSITEVFILSPDVEWIPIEILPLEIQRRFTWVPGDFALTRPNKRTFPKLINAQTVALVEEFRLETTIVEAILRYCDKHQADPKIILHEAFPMLQQLIQARLLIPPKKVRELMPTYAIGDWVIGAKVLNCIQSMDDSELYCVMWNGRKAALKIARSYHCKVMLCREIEVLKQLDGLLAPALIATGMEDQGYPYILIEWLEGVPIDEAAEHLRTLDRSKLLKLCVILLRTYERLHNADLFHGDVHPRNIIVCGEEIKLIDFGLSRMSNELAVALGGVHFYFAPEQAECLLTKQKVPASTALSEQYALGVLIYQLITGNHYLDFKAEQSELLHQILEVQPLPFSHWEQPPWPEVEISLQKALSKAPENRFESLGAFAEKLECFLAPEIPLILLPSASIQTHLKAFLEATQIDGSLLNILCSPTARWSIFDGAAGIAYALFRVACLRSDPTLLATADLWATRAHQNRVVAIEQRSHFSLGELHCVRAMIAQAFGNDALVDEAIQDFLNDSTFSQSSFALLPGISGTLHVCTLLLEMVKVRQDLLEKGNLLLEALWSVPVTTFSTKYLGIAHGWSGILYSTLRWCQVAQSPLPDQLQKYLEELVVLGQSSENGKRWSWRRDKEGYLPGWCNGSSGFYHLWLQASHYQLGKHFMIFAEAAAQHCWELPSSIPNLCCGVVGQIYTLLNFYQHTGENKWREHALQLTKKLAYNPRNQNGGLYQGSVGIALLAAELDYPELAFMPFFAKDPSL
jgi:eukaryotic-like serine/threonine-protein kinase